MRKHGSHERRSKPSLPKLSAMIFCAFVGTATSGCGRTVEGTIAQVCGPNSWREIGVRKGDKIGDETAREIIGNNEARAVWCSKKV